MTDDDSREKRELPLSPPIGSNTERQNRPMATDGLRIAISGPVGAGKTTLAGALATKLRLPMINEDLDRIYAAKKIYFSKSKDASVDQATKKKHFDQWRRSYFDWIDQRSVERANCNFGFVEDRWEADLISVYLFVFGEITTDDTTRLLIQRLKKESKNLDFVVLLPPIMHHREAFNESRLRRDDRFTARLMRYLFTRGLIEQLTRVPCINIPQRQMSVKERVDYVCELINKNAQRC